MSGYWDAVVRTALGLPGLAVPRPRSMFEPDETLATSDDLNAVEQEVDAPVLRLSPTPVVHPAPSFQPIAGHSALEAATAQSPGPQPTQPGDVARERSDTRAEVRAPKTDLSATHDDRVKQTPSPPPSETVARVEVHRIETTRTIDELAATHLPPAGAEGAAWKPIAQEPAPHRGTPSNAVEAAAIELPSVTVAEPVAHSPEPVRQPPPPEPSPLVIEIGRIDIRIASEVAAPLAAPRRNDTGIVPSLEDYLARRSEAKR